MRTSFPTHKSFGPERMKTVVQKDVARCSLAYVPTLAKVSYQQIKTIALGKRITVRENTSLFPGRPYLPMPSSPRNGTAKKIRRSGIG